MSAKKWHFKDDDTGEATMDVVSVPEGFSFQITAVNAEPANGFAYASVLLDPHAAYGLAMAILEDIRS